MDILPGNDVCSTGFLAATLIGVGGLMIRGRRDLEMIGQRIAIAAFLVFLLVRWGGREQLPRMGDVVFGGLIVAGLALGASWIVLPILAFVHEHAVRRPAAEARRWCAEQERKRRDEEARREADRRAAEQRAAWEAAAPERERARLRADEEARRRSESQLRRTRARAAAERQYAFYTAGLGRDWFPREEFDRYLATYLGDDLPPEEVESHGRELVATFERRLAEIRPKKAERTIEAVTRWYTQQKQHIEALDIDPIAKQTLLSNLEERLQDEMDRALGEMSP